MRFADPGWLLLLGLSLVAAVIWWARRYWQRLPFSSHAPEPRRSFRLWVMVLCGLLAASSLVPLALALARPQQVLARNLEQSLGIDIILALDVSQSMAALDFAPSDRLGVAKEVFSEFVMRRPQDRFGIVVFAGAAATLCPLTLDHGTSLSKLAEVSTGRLPEGTALGLGLGTALTRLRKSSAQSKVVVLITDGANNAGQIDPLTAAELAIKSNVVVHTVLVGSDERVPVVFRHRDPVSGRELEQVREMEVETNPALLAEIARLTGGVMFRAQDSAALQMVFDRIDALEKSELTSLSMVRYQERFEPWAWTALVLLLTAVAAETTLGETPW